MAGFTVPAGVNRILIGGSAGSINQVSELLGELEPAKAPPIVLLIHLEGSAQQDRLCEVVSEMLDFSCHIARNGMRLEAGKLYTPLAEYHLLIEPETNTCRLFDDEPYSYSKPSIDLLFSSCVGPEARHTLAILLSGANKDGAQGLADLHAEGAFCAVADPELSLFPTMPASALRLSPGVRVLNPVSLRN